MNLILFEAAEIGQPLVRSDPRAQHVLTVLRRQPGDTFDAAVVDVGRGQAQLRNISPEHIRFDYLPGPPLPSRPDVHLLIGLPRPQTARDILRDGTTLGATAITFVSSARSDPNYAASTLWKRGEWRRHALAGAAQAFDPRLPTVRWNVPLEEAANAIAPEVSRLALDLYEATVSIADLMFAPLQPIALAIGPERGWAAADRKTLRAGGFTLVRLDLPVLRVETAVVAVLTLVSSRRARV